MIWMWLRRMLEGLRSSIMGRLWRWAISRVFGIWRILRAMRDWKTYSCGCLRRRARTRLDDERCESTRNCWNPGPILGKGTFHQGYDTRPNYWRSFLCNLRPLLAILGILSHSNDCRHSGRTRNSRLPRNRIAARRGHHALARPRNRRAEETVEKPLHRTRLGSESASHYSTDSWNPCRDC